MPDIKNTVETETETWYEIEWSLPGADDWFVASGTYDRRPPVDSGLAARGFDQRVVRVTQTREVVK